MPPPTGPKKTSSSALLDPYALIENSVIRDPNGKIKAIKHFPSFANAVVAVIDHAKTLSSALQIVRYLAGAELIFADQGDFERVADQFGIFNALCSVQELVDRNLVKNSLGAKQFFIFVDAIVILVKDRRASQAIKDRADAKKREEVRHVRDRGHDRDGDSDVEMLKEDMATILDRLDVLAIDIAILQSGAEDGPDSKKLKPSVPSYRPGTAFVFSLLKQVDALLEAGGKASKDMLQDYSEVLEQTACQQLFNLDIAQQACKQLIDRRESVRTALDNQDLEKTGILIRDLQVSKAHINSMKARADEAFETAIAGPSNSKSDLIAMAIEDTI
ncbi:hypothetical protein DXG01_004634 [Tephrocybe rancida]|nr:hypothetical protein DXG01_004634 [Tephrocybe rancida]